MYGVGGKMFKEFDSSRLSYFKLPSSLKKYGIKHHHTSYLCKNKNIIDIFNQNANIVDAGCGSNRFKELFPNLIAFDFVDYGRQNFVSTILEAPIKEGSQDGVLCLGVLHECPDEYHKPNIEKMLSWLKPNGLLIMRHKKDSGDNLEERKKSLGSWAGEGSWPRSRINEFTSAFNLKLEWIENHSATRNNIKFDGHVWCWRKYV